MTGAPKIRTCEIIEKLEEFPRGIYSGVIGYFSVSGCADFSVVIRTAVFREQNVGGVAQTNVSVGAGGAIVILSHPEDEFEEMKLKADSVLSSFQWLSTRAFSLRINFFFWNGYQKKARKWFFCKQKN